MLAIWLTGVLVPAHTPIDSSYWVPFPADGDKWTRVGLPDTVTFDQGVTLRSSAVGTNRLSSEIALERPSSDKAWLQLSGRVIEERRQGRSWATASLGVAFVSAEGERFGYRTVRTVPSQGTATERFSRIVEWPARAAAVRILFESRAGAPTFSVLEGSAEAVQPNPRYAMVVAGLVGLIFVWSVVMLRFFGTRDRARLLVIPGLLVTAIVLGVTQSTELLRSAALPVLVLFENVFDIDRELVAVALLKGGHAFGFFLLTLCLWRLRGRLDIEPGPLVAFVALIAVGSEGLQAHIASRDASVMDVLIDLCGVLAAYLLVRLFGSRSHPHKRRRRRTGKRDRRVAPRHVVDRWPSVDIDLVENDSTVRELSTRRRSATRAVSKDFPDRRRGERRRV